MSSFHAPEKTLGTLASAQAANIVGAAADLALILDADGTIVDFTAPAAVFAGRDLSGWIGRPWIDTVTGESRDKVADLVSRTKEGVSRQRQINQLLEDGSSTMVLFSVVPLNEDGRFVAVGKDLSSLELLQKRLINVQQSMERDYSRLREFETRYRMLFQSSSEAILIAQAHTLRIVESNPAACALLGSSERKMVGSGLMRWFDDSVRPELESAIGSARMDGKVQSLALGEALTVVLSVFKTDNTDGHLLVRLRGANDGGGDTSQSEQAHRLTALVEAAPDGLVVTDADGRVVAANTEFLDLAQLTGVDVALGQSLAEWLGQSGIDYQIIMASLRERGSIRLYETRLRGEFGSITDVEVSAVMIKAGETDLVGFAIRDIGRRTAAANDESGNVVTPRSIDQLTQLVGRVPLKELVRESTELIEQLCIQAALKLTNNNRASAAEMLGLSRQSLYVKLRRYALEGEESDPAA